MVDSAFFIKKHLPVGFRDISGLPFFGQAHDLVSNKHLDIITGWERPFIQIWPTFYSEIILNLAFLDVP